jgi:hypothetical protein
MFEPMNGLSERQLSRVPDIADSNIHTGQVGFNKNRKKDLHSGFTLYRISIKIFSI